MSAPTNFDRAQAALDLWILTAFLRHTVESGGIPISQFPEELEVETPESTFRIKMVTDDSALKDDMFNLWMSAAGVCVTQVDTELGTVFGGTPRHRPESDPEIQSVRELIYMLRCAFAHDPVMPTWVIHSAYAKPVEIPTISIKIDLSSLDGIQLDMGHLGGWEKFFKLMILAVKIIKRNQPN